MMDYYIENGEFSSIISLLTKHVYTFGMGLTVNEIMLKLTGAELNSQYWIQPLQARYDDI